MARACFGFVVVTVSKLGASFKAALCTVARSSLRAARESLM